MKKTIPSLLCFFACIVLVLQTAGCGGPVTLSEATMCISLDNTMRPVSPTTVFAPTTPMINLSVKLSNAPNNTEVKAEWYYVKGPERVTNKLVAGSTVVTQGTTYIGFPFGRVEAKAWPIGEYRVDLFLNGEKALSVPFKVD